MTTGYSPEVALIFDRLWGSYSGWLAKEVARVVEDEFGRRTGRLLDVGCGTGRFALHFASRTWDVVGIDPSPAMIERAAAAAAGHYGPARFAIGSLTAFGQDGPYDLVACTYDTLNHAANEREVYQFFDQCSQVLSPGGLVICDFNTAAGLEDWNRVRVTDKPDVMIVSRGVFLREKAIAYKKFNGFCLHDGAWIRFEQTIHNIPIEASQILQMSGASDLQLIRFSSLDNLAMVCNNPLSEGRLVAVLQKPLLRSKPHVTDVS
jgi:SAM-dependent methyltransferase